MARMPGLVVPGYPHHVTQRDNRRKNTLFSTAAYQACHDLVYAVKKSSVWTFYRDYGVTDETEI